MTPFISNDFIERVYTTSIEVIESVKSSTMIRLFQEAIASIHAFIQEAFYTASCIWDFFAGIFSSTQISLLELKRDPSFFLRNICESGIPYSVQFVEFQDTVDVGGLRKHYIRTLVESLLTQNSIPRSDDGFLLLHNENYEYIIKQLGLFYSIVAKKNRSLTLRDKLLIGQLLNEQFFEVVKLAIKTRSKDDNFLAVVNFFSKSSNPFMSLVAQSILTEDQAILEQCRSTFGWFDEDVKEKALELLTPYYQAALAFYDGTQENFRRRIDREDPILLIKEIQGEKITKQALKDALKIRDVSFSDHAYQKKQWLIEKIDSLDEEDPWLEKFLVAVTNSSTFTPGLVIHLDEKGGIFSFHTCFNSIDIPEGRLNKWDFLAGIEACFEESDSHYNTI